MSIYLLMYI